MTTFIQIVGCVSVLGVVAALVLYANACLQDKINQRRWVDDRIKAKAAIRDIGQSLKDQAYWFTEDVGAWVAIETLGAELAKHGSLDIRIVRDNWRADQRRQAAHLHGNQTSNEDAELMATFRSTRPGNVFDPDVWELVPEPPKRATMFTRFRRLIGWFWLPVPWVWRRCWSWEATREAWRIGWREFRAPTKDQSK